MTDGKDQTLETFSQAARLTTVQTKEGGDERAIFCSFRANSSKNTRASEYGLCPSCFVASSTNVECTKETIRSRETMQVLPLALTVAPCRCLSDRGCLTTGRFTAQVFWLVSYLANLVKRRIMIEPPGGGPSNSERRYDKGRRQWDQAERAVYVEGEGLKAF